MRASYIAGIMGSHGVRSSAADSPAEVASRKITESLDTGDNVGDRGCNYMLDINYRASNYPSIIPAGRVWFLLV